MTYLTTEEVCGKLVKVGCDEKEVSKVFAARLEPEGVDKDQKLVLAAEAPDAIWLVVAQFGTGRPLVRSSPLDEGGPDWRPRFISVEGPFVKPPKDEAGAYKTGTEELRVLSEKARELTTT